LDELIPSAVLTLRQEQKCLFSKCFLAANEDSMKIGYFILVLIIGGLAAVAGAQDSIDLAWDWSPGDSGYTSGPNGEVAYDIYMRTDDDPDYAYDYPIVSAIENCWWNIDHYSCETTLTYDFDDEETYHLVAVAYLVDTPAQRSVSSNELTYNSDGTQQVEGATSSGGGGGGGCFIASVVMGNSW
jgi:hypothetical protein